MKTRKTILLSALVLTALLLGAGVPSAAYAADGAPVETSVPLETAAPAEPQQTVQPDVLIPPEATVPPEAQAELSAASIMDAMCQPSGILPLEDGSFLITDTYNKVVWQLADGTASLYAGAETLEGLYGEPVGGYNDAAPEESYFKRPWAIVPFLDGYAVSDTDNNVVRLLLPDGTQTLSGQTTEGLNVTDIGVAFDHPTGLAVDDEGNLYVSDTLQNAVRKIDPDGNVSTVTAALNAPTGLCWKDGTLYIAETGSNRIIKITDGKVMVLAGSRRNGTDDGPAARASFSSPQGVAVDDNGTVYVADTANSAIRRIQNGVVDTLLIRDITDPQTYAPISPVGLAIANGRLYVCDSFARGVFTMDLPQ